MGNQISINTEQAKAIYDKAMALQGSIKEELAQLNKQLMDLPDRGEWRGVAADTFMNVYMDMQNKITTEFPNLLEELANNLNKNLANLIDADNAGA